MTRNTRIMDMDDYRTLRDKLLLVAALLHPYAAAADLGTILEEEGESYPEDYAGSLTSLVDRIIERVKAQKALDEDRSEADEDPFRDPAASPRLD